MPLHFSHYYNFLFIYKSAVLDNGDRVTLQLGGTMEKVSALTVDVADPLTLNEDGEQEIITIKNADNQVIWKQNEEE